MSAPDYVLAATWDEAKLYGLRYPGCRTMSVRSSAVDGMRVRNCYVTPAAAATPWFGPRAIFSMERNIRKTTEGGSLIYLED